MRRTTIRQNVFFAFAYNIVGIPVAAGVLYPFLGVRLSPMIAAGAMALRSLSVVSNPNRLRRFRAKPLAVDAGRPAVESRVDIGVLALTYALGVAGTPWGWHDHPVGPGTQPPHLVIDLGRAVLLGVLAFSGRTDLPSRALLSSALSLAQAQAGSKVAPNASSLMRAKS